MKFIRFGWLAVTLGGLPGCSDALVFGDRSSIEVASVRLNDDVAEPIRVNVGLDRQLVTNAPALGGSAKSDDGSRTVAKGEAISLFSSFRASVQAADLGVESNSQSGALKVHTRFASGAAALAVANKPEIAGAIMGLKPFTLLTPGDADLLEKLSICVNAMDQQRLGEASSAIDLKLSESEQQNEIEAKQAITGRFLESNSVQLQGFATTLKSTCPT